MRGLLLAGALALVASSVRAATATNYYWTNTVSGTTVVSPLLWDDAKNWKDGKVPTGGQYDYIDFYTYGTVANTIWVKMPDDRQVVVGQIRFRSNGVKVRLFGGLGFKFKNNNNTAPDRNRIDEEPTSTSMGDRNIIYTPLYSEKNVLQLKGVELACPVSFGFSDKPQLQFEYAGNRLRNRYAPCGGEVYSPYPGLSYLQQQNAIFLSMPPNCPATNGCWVATKDSKILKWISGVKGGTLAPGQYLHASGVIPEGAYVEYVYGDTYVGLSQPALADSADATVGTAITFDRHYSKLTQSLSTYRAQYADKAALYLQRRTAENAYTFDIGTLSSDTAARTIVLRTETGDGTQQSLDGSPRPGIFRVKDFSAFTGSLIPVNGHIQFAGNTLTQNTLGKLDFLYNQTRIQYYAVRLDTPAGVEAKVGEVSNWLTSGSTGALIDKVGAGTLTIKTSGTSCARLQAREGLLVFDPSAASPTLYSLEVTNGTCRLAANRKLTVTTLNLRSSGTFEAGTNVTLSVSTLNLNSGATFSIGSNSTVSVSSGTIACKTLTVPEGAVLKLGVGVSLAKGLTISGPGRVELVGGYSGVSFTGGAQVAIPGVTTGGSWSTNAPTPAVVGTPALWMDASESSTFTFLNATSRSVTRWNDRRKKSADDNYLFATNIATRYPTAPTNSAGQINYLQIACMSTNRNDGTQGLVWSQPLTGIRAVFAMVHIDGGSSGNYYGGGMLLGRSGRFPYENTADFKMRLGAHGGPYWRGNGGYYWHNDIKFQNVDSRFLSTAAATCVINGPWYINGESIRNPTAASTTYRGIGRQLVESHPTEPGATSDAFGIYYDDNYTYGSTKYYYNGINRYCEVIVYTNALTFAERQQVAEYLMEKWLGHGAALETVGVRATLSADLTGATIEATAGQALKVGLPEDGSVVKTGAGILDLGNPALTNASVTIAEGSAHIRSVSYPTRGGVNTNSWIHLDMTDKNTYTVTASAGTNYITTVYDCHTNGNSIIGHITTPSSQCLFLRSNDLNGLPVLDFGPRRKLSTWGSGNNAFFRKKGSSTDQHPSSYTVLAIMGNQNGGGQLISGIDDGYYQFGWFRNLQNLTSGWATAPLFDDAYANGNFLGKSTDGEKAAKKGYYFRKNGANYNPYTAMDEGYQLISYASDRYAARSDGMGAAGYRNSVGGMRVAEFILATKTWSKADLLYAEAYLQKKWFDKSVEGYRPASLGAVTLAAGTTLTVDGDQPLKVASLGGGGTVAGSVEVMGSSVVEVPVNPDGTITQTLTVSGALDLSKGGTVVLTGDYVRKLKSGRYLIFSAESLTGSAKDWRGTDPAGRKALRFVKDGNGLYLKAISRGLVVYITAGE